MDCFALLAKTGRMVTASSSLSNQVPAFNGGIDIVRYSLPIWPTIVADLI